MGFGVGLWNWPEWVLDALETTGPAFTIMNGYLVGRLTDQTGAERLLASARETAEVGKRLGVQRFNLHGTGPGDGAYRSRSTMRSRRAWNSGRAIRCAGCVTSPRPTA